MKTFLRVRWGRVFCVAAVVAIGGTTSAVAATAQSKKSAGTLVINSFGGSWGQAIQLGLIDRFERQTGIKVKLLSTWDIAKSKAAVQSGNTPPEDILDTDLPTSTDLNRAHLLSPISYGGFNRKVLARIPKYAKLPYAVGWGQFAIGLCYSKSAFAGKAAPKTWADFWNFSKFPGQRGMLSWTAEPQPEFGLIAAGVSPKNLYPLNMTLAMQQMTALKSHVPKFPESPAELGQLLVDHQVVMEACFTHRVQSLINAGVSDIAISYKQARLESEAFVVWKNSPNKANAMKFLNFILSAKPQAAWAQFGNTSPINPDAVKVIAADVRDKIATAPGHGPFFVKNDAWYSAVPKGKTKSNRELVTDAWNKFAQG